MDFAAELFVPDGDNRVVAVERAVVVPAPEAIAAAVAGVAGSGDEPSAVIITADAVGGVVTFGLQMIGVPSGRSCFIGAFKVTARGDDDGGGYDGRELMKFVASCLRTACAGLRD